ncbi:prepilin peptidase [Candidatus Curtissbacteria bacterium]|nr:prepilin peptidase [Candidatus Curtissbacteria bacterium]
MVFLLALFFVLGASVGSFLNVVIDRSIQGRTLTGRSYCDWCGRTLEVADLVPIVSFLVIRGRCRKCRKPLSWQYPAVEGLGGIIFLLTFWKFSGGGDFSLPFLIYLLFICSTLIAVAAVDFKTSLIPTSFVFGAALAALFFNFFSKSSPDFIGFVAAAFGAAAFFAVIIFLTRGRGMGEGDAVLAFLIGMVLGVPGSIIAIFLAFFIGAVAAVFLVVLGKKRFGQTIPFGPFLILGFFVSLFFGQEILRYYLMLY